MKIAFLEYAFDFNKQVSGGSDICVKNMYKLISEQHEVSSFKIIDEDNIDALIQKLDTFDLVIHNFLKGTFNHDDGILVRILTSLKHAVTLYIDHDRYPVYQTFYKQKMKAKVTHACDYILTYSRLMYEQYFEKNRILSINNYLNYRDIPWIDSKRCIDFLYQARISTTKGTIDFYNFLDLLNKKQIKTSNVLVGFGGSPAEIGFKQLPGNILHIWKDKNRVQYNSDNTFLHVHPFQKDFNILISTLRASKFAWNCYRINTKKPENLTMDKGLEGAALESILCGTIPILNGHQRTLMIEDKKLEDYYCCLFLDDGNHEKLAQDYMTCLNNYDIYYNNLRYLASILSNTQKYRNNYNNIINYCIAAGKQQTAIIKESTYKELKEKNLRILDKETECHI